MDLVIAPAQRNPPNCDWSSECMLPVEDQILGTSIELHEGFTLKLRTTRESSSPTECS
jgi:hypothetical protein